MSQLGIVVEEEWLKTAELRPEVELGEFVIMPNHFHAIIGITGTTGVTDTPMQTGVSAHGGQVRYAPTVTIKNHWYNYSWI